MKADNTLDAVEQVDRDAAAAIVRKGNPGVGNGNKVIASEIKGKLHDDYAIVQAFARHRLTHQPDRAAVEALREALETKRDYVSDVANGHVFHPGCADEASIRLMAVQDLLNINQALANLERTK